MRKIRLDQHLVNLGLVESRNRAQRAIDEGLIKVDGIIANKASQMVTPDCNIAIIARPEFVSRAGLKLKAALEHFKLSPLNKICADVGASTGGFTDCLLQYGARKVYAIDVGQGELHESLRNNPLVVVMEHTNARQLKSLAEPVDFVTIDVSFISLDYILPVVLNWFGGKPGEVVALVKPQFEAGREIVKHTNGVIRDSAVHAKVLEQVMTLAQKLGYGLAGLIRSPLTGSDGNTEFLLALRVGSNSDHISIPEAIAQVISQENE
jgi:23S rRNA (cytidine1920-2'-O)/16S rRNA (cytidine1409-2'-O)-methyltransferase